MEKKFKVESKGSLWEVSLSSGCYSDWDINFYVFSGNSQEEVWEFVKIWAKEGGLEDSYKNGLVWNENKFEFSRPDYWHADYELDWDTDYGDALKVEIARLEVIYVNP